jgi:hypothetical protein
MFRRARSAPTLRTFKSSQEGFVAHDSHQADMTLIENTSDTVMKFASALNSLRTTTKKGQCRSDLLFAVVDSVESVTTVAESEAGVNHMPLKVPLVTLRTFASSLLETLPTDLMKPAEDFMKTISGKLKSQLADVSKVVNGKSWYASASAKIIKDLGSAEFTTWMRPLVTAYPAADVDSKLTSIAQVHSNHNS